jgi:hypothetical protein
MHGPMPNIKMGKLKQNNQNNQEAMMEGHKGALSLNEDLR